MSRSRSLSKKKKKNGSNPYAEDKLCCQPSSPDPQVTFCWMWTAWIWRGWREARRWPTSRTLPLPSCSRSWRCVRPTTTRRSSRCRRVFRRRPQTAPRAPCPTTITPRCGSPGCRYPGERPYCDICLRLYIFYLFICLGFHSSNVSSWPSPAGARWRVDRNSGNETLMILLRHFKKNIWYL